jgi:type IV secretion system protein VirB9
MRTRPLLMLLGVLALATLGSRAYAEQSPVGGSFDSRMRYVAYNPGQVVHLSTLVGNTMVVSFSATETVTAVAETDTIHLTLLWQIFSVFRVFGILRSTLA